MAERILVVDDSNDIRAFTTIALKDAGFHVDEASSGAQALLKLQKNIYDMIVLDLGLPDMKGESVCRKAKELNPEQLVLMLTGRSSSHDVIHGFEVGADDYVSKPFDPDELVARIHARLKAHKPQTDAITIGRLSLDTQRKTAHIDNEAIELTPQEYRLLEYLMMNAEKTVSRDMILNRLWSAGSDVESRVVDVYIGYLRNKIDKPHGVHYIHSVRGFGYMFSAQN